MAATPSKPSPDATASHAPAAPCGDATSSPVPGGTISQAGPSEAALAAGAALLVPGYEVLGELGRGGMGVVYLAKNVLMDRREVLKVVNKALLDRPGVMERFLREIRAAAMLNHNNVVKAYSAMQAGESIIFAMEYVDGEDLNKVVQRQGPLPIAHACHYISQAALGLQHAYEHRMVHRDIKPHNLILSRQAKRHVVKVLDFGLAKAKREGEASVDLTGEGAMMGTPAYMAPEQARDAASADVRADIYSLGCTLYFLLTGAPPFSGKSLYAVLQAHESTEAAPLHQLRAEAPPELSVVVARMMAKDPARRFQTPIEAAQALTSFIKPGSTPKSGMAWAPLVPAAPNVAPARPAAAPQQPPPAHVAAIPLPPATVRPAKQATMGAVVWAEVDGVLHGAPAPARRATGDTGIRPAVTAKKKANARPAGSAPQKGRKVWWWAAGMGLVVTLLAAGEVWLWSDGALLGEAPRDARVGPPPSAKTATSSKSVDLEPHDAEGHFDRGCELDDAGRWDDAIAEYRQAIKARLNYVDAHINLGVALAHKGQTDEAIAEYRQALEGRPDDPMAHNNLGCRLYAKGRWDEAAAEYRQAIAHKPDFADAHNNLGLALRRQGQSEEATAEFSKAAELRKTQQK